MNPSILRPVVAGLFGLSTLGLAAQAQAAEERARVISSTPVLEQVAVPREVCRDEVVTVEGRKSGAGALIGGIAGGAMGNAVGRGSGRAAATVIGVIGGAVLGDRIEGNDQPQTQTVRQCHTRTVYENQTMAYDVVYEYAGKRYSVQMDQDPGPYVRLNLSPVGELMDEPQPPVRYRTDAPYVDDRRVVTRVEVGTTYIPTYTVAPRVVYIGGQREYHRHPGHARRDNRRDDWRDGRRDNSRDDRPSRYDSRGDRWDRIER